MYLTALRLFINRYNAVLLANHGALSWGKDLYQALYRMEALEHQAGILFGPYSGHITGRDVRIYPEALAGLVLNPGREMGILTGEFGGNVSGSVQTSYLHKYGPDFPAQPCSIHARLFPLLIYGIRLPYAQSVHGNLLIHVLAPGLG